MKNLWVTQDEPIATWVADLSSVRSDAASLQKWLLDTLAFGETCDVYSVQEAPLLRYRRERDGPLVEYLSGKVLEEGVVDLFQFAASRFRQIEGSQFRTVALIAYFDMLGRLTSSYVADLGALLKTLRPADVPVAAGLTASCPALAIHGPRISFAYPEQSIWDLKADQVKIRFQIHSDVWFPWVRGFLDDSFDLERWRDNRALAQFHTGRLNRFLSFVCESTCRIGGSWDLDHDASKKSLNFMLEPKGILLDVQA
ncbi:hypothetical protein [Paraburkholderia sp. BR14374]|uniref:hypothetical protein n=1 Tax=Paraburkholderia sp. BR14374 TaxID=3237007 RepID=UPI0034CF41BC